MSTSGSPAGKGRPTPKRRDARPRRGGPVAPPPASRREAAKRLREQGRQQRSQVRASARTGDTRYQLKRDQGPVRAYVRDLVDARRHIAVALLPAAFLPLLGQLTGSAQLLALATSIWLATLLASFGDLVVTALYVRSRLRSRFPDDRGRGHLFYAVMRTAQFRRLRMPRPVVRVGEQV